ncbi:patatin-like phospholipase RssA [Shewanella sp. WXL01]|uniref:patatin-like phospholipase RssA n=1 Tax=Shewanella sp. WXL01 TaxID=2709721 RepID=UPI0014383BDB|nr:patatin-like phospholipase RssA [Shewanella sp. WXL01]NKF50400.1 patatin-like phospholipase RssA [Shewanella sp. WXL01]
MAQGEQIGSSMRIGIALGSGAAKGWAHIGVFKALAELGIYPDKVAGCSAGALVGAAYSAGLLEELQGWVTGFSSWDIVGLMDLSWRKGGIISGEKVFDVLGSRVGDKKIEDLDKPFAAVATDLYSGQEIWFREGDLRNAVKASCSMPGFLPPVKQGNRWLVDGAVVNPVPVSLSRAMDVDFVIAVDLHGHHAETVHNLPQQMASEASSVKPDDFEHENVQDNEQTQAQEAEHDWSFVDLLGRGKEYVSNLSEKFSLNAADIAGGQAKQGRKSNPGMLAVMTQSMEILEERHKRARLMGDPPEICIIPNVAGIGTMEFHRAQEAIDAGYQAVKDVEHILRAKLGV